MINEERLQKLFIELVEIDSPSGHEARLRDFLKDIWQQRGLFIEEDEAGRRLGGDSGNILIRIPGTRPGPAILFCAHMDTVEPGRGIKARVDEDGYIRSAGETILGSDDKVAIAALLEVYDCLQETNCPIRIWNFCLRSARNRGF
jgi:Cellulase M and related proteins